MPVETMERKHPFNIELFPEEKREPLGDIKYIGWDKDGTLFDNMKEFSEIPSRELEKRFGVPQQKSRPLLNIGFNEGIPLEKTIRDLVRCDKEELVTVVRMIKSEIVKIPPVLFEDVLPTLIRLRREGYRMFVHSKHQRYVIQEQMKTLNMSHFFEAFIGKSHKKGEEGFRQAAKVMNVPYDEFRKSLAYVGDSVFDAIAAKNAKVAFIGRNSYIEEDQYEGNKYVLYDAGGANLVVDNFYGLPSRLPNLLKVIGEPPKSLGL